jgi:hypothetical protein
LSCEAPRLGRLGQGRSGRRSSVVCALMISCATIVSACGVPNITTPQPVPTNPADDTLVDDIRTSPLQPSRDQTVSLFFLRDRRLVRRLQVVTVPSLTRAEDLAQDVVDKLLAGPSASDQKVGITSLVERVASTDQRAPIVINLVTDGTVRVDLGATRLSKLPEEEQILALAQIVYTLTSLSGIGRVEFLSDTKEMAVLTGQGVRTGEVFASLFECAERGSCGADQGQSPASAAAPSTTAGTSAAGRVPTTTQRRSSGATAEP